jgi:hypothetical protein
MFMGCSSLRKLPQLSISNATTVRGLFAGTSIKTVPDLGLSYSNCTDFSQMFYECRNLEEAPVMDTSNGTAFDQMFMDCISLKKVPLYDFSKGKTFSWQFYGCPLEEVPAFDFSNATDLGNASGLSAINAVTMPAWIIGPKLTSFQMSAQCLRVFPAIDFSLCTGLTAANSFTVYAPSLQRSLAKGLRCSHAYNSYCLSRTALVEIFTNLGPAIAGATLTLSSGSLLSSGVLDLTAEDKAIATAKGWTIAY